MTCRAALVLALLSALALGAESPKPAEPPKPMEAPKANEAPKPAEAAKPPAAPAPKEKKMNRLAKEKSPYLLQHADNPVDWYPWGDEAFEKAKKEDKPVFVYRMVATGTVEARIHAMQDRKQKLADGVLQEQKADSIRFSMDDLASLFAPIGKSLPMA